MFIGTILYGIALLIIVGCLLLGLIYSFEAKIKVNNNPNYKNDQNLKDAFLNLNIAFWICLVAIIIVIVCVVLFFVFIEVLGFFIKIILVVACVVLFLLLIYIEYLFFSAVINIKNSASYTGEGDDKTALRNAKTGAWSIFVCLFTIVIFIVLILFFKFSKKNKKK